MNNHHHSPSDALTILLHALESGDSHAIATALETCRMSLHAEAWSNEDLQALAIIFAETEGGKLPVSLEVLRYASEEQYLTNIDWDSVLTSLLAVEAVSLKRPDGSNIHFDDLRDMNAELQTDDEGPLEFCTVDLLPRYAVEQRGTDTDTVASNRRYLQEALHYLDVLLEHNHVHSAQSRVQQKSSLDAEFDRIRTTGQRVQPMLPLEKLCRIFSFDRTDWTLIILALRTQLIGDEINVTLAAELLSREPEDRNQVLNHLRPKSALVKSGILQIHQPKRNTSKTVSLPLDIIQYIICSAHPPYSVRRRLQIMEPFDDFHDYHSAWIKLARAAIDLD